MPLPTLIRRRLSGQAYNPPHPHPHCPFYLFLEEKFYRTRFQSGSLSFACWCGESFLQPVYFFPEQEILVLASQFTKLAARIAGVIKPAANTDITGPLQELNVWWELSEHYLIKCASALIHTLYIKSLPTDKVWVYFFLVMLQLRPPGTWQTTKKKREGSSRGESKRKLLKETQNQGKETRKKKRTQVEYRVEGAQDRRRRRKPGGWKETPNTRKRGGDVQSCSCWDKSGKHRSTAKRG